MGLFKKPKTPPPSPQDIALQNRQQEALSDETRETNARLKAIKRGAVGRRRLLGSFKPASGMGGGGSVRGGRAGRGGGNAGGGSGGFSGAIMGSAGGPSGGHAR